MNVMQPADIKGRRQALPELGLVARNEKEASDLKQKRDAAFSRIAKVNSKRPIHSYIKVGPSGVEEVCCKVCGTMLRGMAPHPGYKEQRSENGKNVIYERLVMMTFPFYTEVTLDFDDGSHHVTLCCSDCAGKIKVEDLEWHYATDMYEMDLEAKGGLAWQ